VEEVMEVCRGAAVTEVKEVKEVEEDMYHCEEARRADVAIPEK
jgi:hypothetical protein